MPNGSAGESEHFTYTLEQDSGNSALVIANEDYTGVNPDYPPSVTAPKYLDDHLAALEANGVTADAWDVDAQGVPHDLGVLSHYDTVVWYLGDNRLTQDPEDELTDIGGDQVPDQAVAERQQYLTLAVRDFLNECGKLLLAGETTALLRHPRAARSVASTTASTARPRRTAPSPSTCSATACCWPTTSRSTTWAPTGEPRSTRPRGVAASTRDRWPASRPPSAATPSPTTRSTRRARSG